MTPRWLLLFLFSLTATSVSFAQEDVIRPNGRPGEAPRARTQRTTKGLTWRLGLETGVNFNNSSRTIGGASGTSLFQTYASGSGISPFFGLYVEAQLSPTIAVGARVLYDMKSVQGTKNDVIRDCSIPDPYGGVSFVQAQIAAEFENTISYFTINPVLRFTLADRFFVHAGPVLQVAASKLESRLTQSVSPDEACRFVDENGDFTLTTIESTNTENANPSTRFGLDAGIGYRLPIGSKIDLVPRIGYQFMFTEYAQGTNLIDDTQAITDPPARNVSISTASLHSLQLSLALWFTL